LYNTNTRFLYELIQNAEDNRYHDASSRSEVPRLDFTLRPDRIWIDSNEDGFTEADIRAICSTGESTKTNLTGYIGEKGIGFKSVFKIAHRVHIQSEPFSFVFRYRRDDTNDNGIGMTTPFNEPHGEIPNWAKTRMTLHLLEDEDMKNLQSQFLNLQGILLMFLRQLRQLSVRIQLPDHDPVERVYSMSINAQRVSINKRVGTTVITQNFWTKKRHVTHMPKDHLRKKVNEADIVLAFPLDAQDMPVLADQQAFAFLPLRTVGYKVCLAKMADLV
jgi:hypothetical protein